MDPQDPLAINTPCGPVVIQCSGLQLSYYMIKYALMLAQDRAGPDEPSSRSRALYKELTEGRDGYNNGIRYGWCGDQVTKLLFDGGVRHVRINRKEMNNKWSPGNNIRWLERLMKDDKAIVYNPSISQLYQGWLYVVENPGHIGIVLRKGPSSLETLDGNGYGRVSACQKRTHKGANSKVINGNRPLMWAAPIDAFEPYRIATPRPLSQVGAGTGPVVSSLVDSASGDGGTIS